MGHLFSKYRSSRDQTNMPLGSSDIKLFNFLLWRALQQKLSSRDLTLSYETRCIKLLGLIGLDAINGVRNELLKRTAIVFMVHDRHDEFLLTY